MLLNTSDQPATKPGRPRDEGARRKILTAALHLLQTESFTKVTCEGIAAQAGVGKATVYRWWPNKAAVMIEAFREMVAPEIPFPDTGSFEDDIRMQIKQFTRMLMGPRGRMLIAIVAAAQSDPIVAAALSEYWIQPRRAEAKAALLRKQQWQDSCHNVDAELVLDVLYGPLYYRLMTALPLSDAYAKSLTDMILCALNPRRVEL